MASKLKIPNNGAKIEIDSDLNSIFQISLLFHTLPEMA
jgi:hypothetical protein